MAIRRTKAKQATARVRLRGRRRRLALVSAVAVLAAGGVRALPASADDSNGVANILFYDSEDRVIEWGQSVNFSGIMTDESASCLTFPHDCDTPTGYLTLRAGDHSFGYGQTTLDFNPGRDYAPFNLDLPSERFRIGTQYVVFDYQGNFDPFSTYLPVTMVKAPCRTFTLGQSTDGSKPGQPVTFTADLGPGDRTGTIAIYDSTLGLLGQTTSIADGRSFSTTTSALPQGDSTLYATYSGDEHHEGCEPALLSHKVSADAFPTARDDFASVAIGDTVSIPVLANDSDDGPTLRSETSNDPDFGEFEKVGDEYLYTPDPDMGNYQDSFDYFDYDSIGQSSAEAHVVITVGCTPNARNDRYVIRADNPLEVAAERGVRANDDACDSPVSVKAGPAHGTVQLAADGSFTYQAVDGYVGDDSFTYEYTDQLDTPVDARVYVGVIARQLPPPPTSTTTTASTTSTSTTTTEPTTTSSTTASSTTASSTTASSTTTSTTTTTTTTPPPTTSEVALTGLYERLFGRAPDPSGSATWLAKLDGGSSPASVARALVDSGEFQRRMVGQAYEQCLGRPADPSGLAHWLRVLAAAGPGAVRSGLLASPEAWASAGGDATGWTDALFHAALGRDATPDEHLVVDHRVTSPADRRTAAGTLLDTAAARRHLAGLWYQAILGRAPTAEEAEAWATALAAGRSERSLVAALAAEGVTPA